jgi:hypothetical protein
MSDQDPVGTHTNYHSQFNFQSNKDITSEVIPEVSEADERDKISSVNE